MEQNKQFISIIIHSQKKDKLMKGYAEANKTIKLDYTFGSFCLTFKDVKKGKIILETNEPLCISNGITFNLTKSQTKFTWNTFCPLILVLPVFDCDVSFKFSINKGE